METTLPNEVSIAEYSEKTLLDYFAAEALPALIARDTRIAEFENSEDFKKKQPPAFYGDSGAYVELAEEAYCIAWAMLLERKHPFNQ